MIVTRRPLGVTAAGLLAAPRIVAADPIVVGMIVPMTGAGAEPGKLAADGANLALEEVNQERVLGRPVRIMQRTIGQATRGRCSPSRG